MALETISSTVVPLTRHDKFEEWWDLYPTPRRTGKAICRAKWDAITGPTGLRTRSLDRDSGSYVPLTLSATPEEIIAGLKRSRAKWLNPERSSKMWVDDAKFVPMPATWLNQGRWMD